MIRPTNKLPWFAFYPSDFLSSTMEMGPATIGAYIRLLSHQWLMGCIPLDERVRKRIAGDDPSIDWDGILSRLVEVDGGLAHPRMLEEQRRSKQIAEKRRSHIQRVNENRSRSRSQSANNCDSDCDNQCPTTTTTTTTTNTPQPPSASQRAIEALCERERLDRGGVEQLIRANRRGVEKRLNAVGVPAEQIEEFWVAMFRRWIDSGDRPYNSILKLTDNLKGCRDVTAVLRHRLAAAR